MSNVIDFPTNRIESIPQLYEQREYRMEIDGRDISVYRSEVLGEWLWRTEDCRWWDDEFFGSGVGFATAVEAQQDALNRVADMNGKSPLFRQIIGITQAHDAKAEGGA